MIFKNLVSSVNSWNDFKNVLETKTKLEKGKAFEELTKYYLQYNPVYKTKIKNVWLQNEISPSVLKKLNLPSNDQGIDLIAETVEGTYWAIQCKYLQDEDQRLSHRTISTFVSLSTGIAENITYCLVCTTVDDYAKIYQGKSNIGFCNADEWRKLDKDFFDWLRGKLIGMEKNLLPYKPKTHQAKALKETQTYFADENNTRGKLVFPCGAGKSLTGYWITKELNAKSIIVAVPSLSLVKQTLEVYLRETVANNDSVEWLCVCSDEGIGKNDDIVIHTNEIGVPCVTDKSFIADWLKENSSKKTIVFTTYQSGKIISEACKIVKHSFDVGIMDEAHKTVGEMDKLFSHLLFDKNLKIRKRIFMTATERRYAGSSDKVLSMDDVNVYGETFAQLSFKEAIEIGILSDYRIITLFISDEEVKRLIEQNAFVKPTGKEWDKETEARTLASLIAVRKAMTEHPINHAVTFHSSIKKAEAFEQSQAVFSSAYPKFANVESFHVSGTMPTSVRSKIVDEFSETDKAIITNAKCLTEGVDVPNIDCVLFADPRKSTVDIVQAVGRALRIKEGKKFGYVILPVFTKSNKANEIIESDEFNEILTTLRALASNDERIIEYFRDISKGKTGNKKDSLIQFEIDELIIEKINEKILIDSIQLKTWNKLAKLSWMPFEEAREFVRGLNFKSRNDWDRYCKMGKKPFNIPSIPGVTYKNNEWSGWGDWLGTGNIANFLKSYLPFNEARKFVHQLNLKSEKEWREYIKTGKKPITIPSAPARTYKEGGWISMGDWLGTGRIADQLRQYIPFNEARVFVHKLKLKSRDEWKKYCKTDNKPNDIPSYPDNVYKEKGWVSMGDWLGTGTIAPRLRTYKSFEDAKEFAQSLKLKSVNDWVDFCKSINKPNDIPYSPNNTYKNKGWVNWGDWLGTGTEANSLRNYLPFEEARSFAHTLKLKTWKEWVQFSKTENKPVNIPKNPLSVYKRKGWIDIGDWLGTNSVANYKIKYREFNEAKSFAQSLNLKSWKEWKEYCKKKRIPNDIPASPNQTYKRKGWISVGDWLGTSTIASYNLQFKDFEEARDFVRKLDLKSNKDWKVYSKSSNRPINIPASPDNSYKEKGWISWGDWLGTKSIYKGDFEKFEEARKFVRNLNLNSSKEWRAYCKSGDKPNFIPTNPQKIYKNTGWKDLGDWLGTGTKATRFRKYRTFVEAREYIHSLHLKNYNDWGNFCKSGKKPDDIPSHPQIIFKNTGWKDMGDWLGTKQKQVL